MNKLKYDLIRKIYDDTSLTSDELNMILWLAKNADDFGTVTGMYYKEVSKELSVCHSQFYNIISSLQKKGYIKKSKDYSTDMNITLEENMFIVSDDRGNPVTEYRDYLNMNMSIFEDSDFYSLKACAKKLLLAIIVKTVNDRARRKKNGGKTYAKIFHVPIKMFKIYADKLHITIRMVKSYFKDISKWIIIYNDNEYTSAEIISIKENAIKKPEIFIKEKGKTVIKKKTDRFDSDMTFIKMLCRRRNMESDEESLTDAAMLLSQYQNRAKEIGQNIRSIIERTISSIGSTLSAAGLNKYISNYIANAKSNAANTEDRILPEVLEDDENYTPSVKNGKKSQFCNFHQRTYDYDELEKILLERK